MRAGTRTAAGTGTAARTRTAALVAAALVAVGLGTAGSAQAAGSTAVKITNAGYAPAALTVPYATKVTWTSTQGTHTVTDTTRAALFSSGPVAQGKTFAVSFPSAGTFTYRSTVGPAMTGSVAVQMALKPATGTRATLFNVAWAKTSLPTGFSEQIEIKPPGGGWESFVFGTPVHDASMRPQDWGNKTGTYSFRAKVYRGSTPSRSSGWSPIATVSVH